LGKNSKQLLRALAQTSHLYNGHIVKKSICFVLPGWVTKHTGGAEWQAFLLSEEFVKNAWQVNVITSAAKTSVKHELFNPQVNYYYYPTTKIKILQFAIALFYVFNSKSKFYYTRTDDRIFRAAIALVCKIKQKKMIYALAGDDELENNKFIYKAPINFKTIMKKFDYLLINYLTRKSEHKADKIICQTNYQRTKLNEVKGLRSTVIPNSFISSNKIVDYEKKENIILWVGNLRQVKRPELFLDVARMALHSNFRFIMIGGNEGYLYENEVPENVEILGMKNKEETISFFSKAKILINTSITEGFSNTFLEAWYNMVWVESLYVDPDLIFSKYGYGNVHLGSLESLILSVQKKIDGERIDIQKLLEAKQYVVDKHNLNKNFKKLEILLSEN